MTNLSGYTIYVEDNWGVHEYYANKIKLGAIIKVDIDGVEYPVFPRIVNKTVHEHGHVHKFKTWNWFVKLKTKSAKGNSSTKLTNLYDLVGVDPDDDWYDDLPPQHTVTVVKATTAEWQNNG
jgi:hypothetical protein